MVERVAKIDETTGLPELPKGHYWDVETYHSEYYGQRLVIRLKRKAEKPYGNWFQRTFKPGKYAPTTVGSMQFSENALKDWTRKAAAKGQASDPDAIITKALKAYATELVQDNWEELFSIDLVKVMSKYSGTYPPKNIDNV